MLRVSSEIASDGDGAVRMRGRELGKRLMGREIGVENKLWRFVNREKPFRRVPSNVVAIRP